MEESEAIDGEMREEEASRYDREETDALSFDRQTTIRNDDIVSNSRDNMAPKAHHK